MSVDPVSIAIEATLIAANMALTASQHIEGPRLTDLSVTTADYGTAMNYAYGRRRFDGCSCIWAEPLKEVKKDEKTKGGKYSNYTYYGTWAIAVCDQPVEAITKIWFDRQLVYDATSAGPLTIASFVAALAKLGALPSEYSKFIRLYLGTADQDVDPRMSATIDAEFGAGSTPAYRGVTYIVFEDLPLEKIGNRLPQVSVEVITTSTPNYPTTIRDAATTSFYNGFGMSYSPDKTRVFWGQGEDYEMWDVSIHALMAAGSIPNKYGQTGVGVTNDGSVYLLTTNGNPPPSVTLWEYGSDLTIQLGSWELGQADWCTVCEDGQAVEYVCVTSWSTYNDGWIHTHGTAGAPELLDTSAHTGQQWQIRFFCSDARGDVWAFGSLGDLAADTLAMWRIVNTSGVGDIDYHFITMPSNQVGGLTKVAAFHCLTDTVDQFVIAWPGYLLTIDCNTWTITNTRAFGLDPLNTAPQFLAVVPGAATFWLTDASVSGGGASQISGEDLTTIRSAALSDWGFSSVPGLMYDFVNNALFVSDGTDQIAWLYLDRVASPGVTLQSIVDDVSARSGLVSGDWDASDLDQVIEGYSWSQGTGKQILEPLLEAYDSEARPHDFEVEFRKRTVTSLGTITTAEMGAGGGDRYQITRTLDTDLPQSVALTFADPTKDEQSNTAIAQRPAAVMDSKRQLSLDLTTLALGVDTARQIAAGYLRRQWYGAEKTSNALTRARSALEPGDCYTLTLDDVTRVARLQKLEFGANGVLSCEWQRDAAEVHNDLGLTGADGDGLVVSTIPVFGYTKGLVLDTPLAKDGDEGLIVYAVASPYSAGVAWPGATFFESVDAVNYSTALVEVASTQTGTIGAATGALADAASTVWDRGSTVTVKMFSGTLASATEAEVCNGANLALIGDELVGFTTATLVDTATYQLSGFLRGRRGTEWATGSHTTGDRFVLMSRTVRAVQGASDVGAVRYFKPITNGGATAFVQTMTYTGASLKPYAPCHLSVANVSGDKVIAWTRRTRIGGAWRDFQDASLGEGSEAYAVDILDGGGAVLRTLSGLTTPTAAYTAAQQSTDGGAGVTAKVYQISTTVGRGFPATVSL